MKEQNNHIQNNVTGSNNNVGNVNNGGNIGNNYPNNTSQEESIREVVKEIKNIFDNLSKANTMNSTTEKIAVVEKVIQNIETKPKLKTKIINSLQAGLIESLKQTLKHPATSIFIAVIEEWKK